VASLFGIGNINSVLTKLERVYGANLRIEDYTELSVSDCVKAALYDLERFADDSMFDSLFGQADVVMQEFASLSAVAYYGGDSIVIFDNFPNASEVAHLLLYATKLSYSNGLTDSTLRKLIAYVMLVEEEYIEFRGSNAYRCLKLVVMMLLYRSSVHAAILSRFVIHQMAVSIGLR
jgi:hypothetical protein